MSENMNTADKGQNFMNEVVQPDFQNWVKGIIAQNITRKTLCNVIERKWKIYISELKEEEVEHIEIFMTCLEKSKINFKAEIKTLRCGHNVCESLLTRLLELRNFSPEPPETNYFQTTEDVIYKRHEACEDKPIEKTKTEAVLNSQNIFSTDSLIGYWPFAKLYAPTENVVSRNSLEDLDMVNVVELLERCTLFSFSGSQKVYKDICLSRNAWLQSSNNKASKEDTEASLQCFLNLLKNFEDSNFYQCSDAIADLQQLVNTDLCCEYKGTEYMDLVKMTLEMKVTALSFDISIGKIADAENICLDTLMKDTKNLLELVEELISEEESDEVTTLKSENESLKSEVMRLQRETELLKKQGCSGKPEATEVEMESVTLTWDQSSDLRDTDYYQIHYKEETDCEWSIHPEKHTSTTAVLANLNPGATYIFRIKIVRDAEYVYSPESDAIVTLHSQAALLVEEAEKLEDFSLATYLLPLTEIMQNDETKIIKYLVGA
ncbi:uncharacterized protein LOC128554148, partial [Mercenaria mercenaria]|uniref:uncharacterized protein LOC128554148 n=1 Tax=Mercenaria mercenaria TaxID=6596 RepID=UPI00234F0CEE